MKNTNALTKLTMTLALIVLLAFAATAAQAQDVIHTASGNCFDVVWNQTQHTLDVTFKWSGGRHWRAHLWYIGGAWQKEGAHGWRIASGHYTTTWATTYGASPTAPVQHTVSSSNRKTWLDITLITRNWMCIDNFWLGDRSGPPS